MVKRGTKKVVSSKAIKPILLRTLRIKAKDLKTYEKTKTSWKISKKKFPEVKKIVKLFKSHQNFSVLVDKKNPEFLKGQLSPEGKPQGARINLLPDNKILDKAYSLFAEQLTFHDQSSHAHWDVLYKNPGGTYSYVYTLEKKAKTKQKKYCVVKEFGKYYPKLQRNVFSALKNKQDDLALPMYTLLRTKMRVGNEIYYKAHGHKGLTTLTKEDIKIKGNQVIFTYVGKDGVPNKIEEKFPTAYTKKLNQLIKPLKKSDFIFVNKNTGHPLSDVHLKKAFKQYCGKEFYPHIVRSYYATVTTQEFLKRHHSATKQEVKDFFTSVAHTLGHKKFVKKTGTWEESYNVTIHHYIRPDLVEKVKGLVK
jgi:hypothetical protein